MLNSILKETVSNTNIENILICGVVALLLGVLVAFIHKYTYKSNKNFLIAISILPLLIESVILLVNGNLGTSIATVGAFSLVRFRSIPGSSREILVVFFAMTIGLACGVGYIGYATMITILGCIALILFSKIKIFNSKNTEKILKITIPENLDYTNIFNDELNKYTKMAKLEKVKTTNMGSLFELSYRVTLNKGINEKEFIDSLRIKNGNLKIILSEELIDNEL